MTKSDNSAIVYQGEPGANSHLACLQAFPDMTPVAGRTFEDVIAAVQSGAARLAMIPIENSVSGRVADIHHLLPASELFIVGEHFERIRHQLLALPGIAIEDLKTVHSHAMALGQCRITMRDMGLDAVPEADTAMSARMVKESGDSAMAAISTALSAEIYGLQIIRSDVEDAEHNTTRFVILSGDHEIAEPSKGLVLTTFIFDVRNMPAALYKALGGFATNGVNMTKLESYQLDGSFNATMFYADIEGHPDERPVQLAMEELEFFSNEVRVLGTYPASPFRLKLKKKMDAKTAAAAIASRA